MISSRIFRSRWAALLWAGGVVWTAYDIASAVAPHHRAAAGTDSAKATSAGVVEDAAGMPIDPADLAILANAGG